LACLAQSLHDGGAQLAVIAADWKKVARARSHQPSVLRDLVGSTREVEPVSSTNAAPPPRPTRSSEVRTLVEAAVRRVSGGRSNTVLDPQLPLRELGFDSLMAVELRNELSANIGLSLSSTLVFDHPTIEGLAKHVSERLGLGRKVAKHADSTKDEPRPRKPALRDVSRGASEDATVARLERELAALEGFLE
jgi:acyl carrier protein